MKNDKLINECSKISKIEDIKNCKPLCEKFDYVHYSKFFDGEKKFLERVYDFILNVVRSHGFKFKVDKKIYTTKEPHYNSNIPIE